MRLISQDGNSGVPDEESRDEFNERLEKNQ